MSSQRRALDSKTSESLAYPALASATTSATSLVLPTVDPLRFVYRYLLKLP